MAGFCLISHDVLPTFWQTSKASESRIILELSGLSDWEAEFRLRWGFSLFLEASTEALQPEEPKARSNWLGRSRQQTNHVRSLRE